MPSEALKKLSAAIRSLLTVCPRTFDGPTELVFTSRSCRRPNVALAGKPRIYGILCVRTALQQAKWRWELVGAAKRNRKTWEPNGVIRRNNLYTALPLVRTRVTEPSLPLTSHSGRV